MDGSKIDEIRRISVFPVWTHSFPALKQTDKKEKTLSKSKTKKVKVDSPLNSINVHQSYKGFTLGQTLFTKNQYTH